jgi:hypothetical protein
LKLAAVDVWLLGKNNWHRRDHNTANGQDVFALIACGLATAILDQYMDWLLGTFQR